MAHSFTTFGSTLTSGIQDISALLPLLGTEQCENHIGSALEGGYLYAAVTVISIFGSLGIVKAGIAVLIASISIPTITISFHPFSVRWSGRRWLGAQSLKNAGFKLPGKVAPKIGIDRSEESSSPPGSRPRPDSERYAAETSMLENLEEKHIDDPERLSIQYTSLGWNAGLVVTTFIAALISGTPYIHLLSKDLDGVHLDARWVFPFLRTIGSCLAAMSIQFIIQLRVITAMKKRIIFMVMNRVLINDLKSNGDNNPELTLQQQSDFIWDSNFPAEESLSSLELYLKDPPTPPISQKTDENGAVSIQMGLFHRDGPRHILDKLVELRQQHFRTPSRDRFFLISSWLLLLLGIPAIVVGYVGCFTIVSNSKQSSGPFIWLGLEVALMVVRVFLWAWNPKWDEKTRVTMQLKLCDHPPLVTTEKDEGVIRTTGQSVLTLVPEHQFLEHITPYTGPLEQFNSPENTVLFYTMSGNRDSKKICLYLTISDLSKCTALTLHHNGKGMTYEDAQITPDPDTGELQAKLQSCITADHPRRANHVTLYNNLNEYYTSLLRALHPQRDTQNDPQHFLPTALLPWQWNLSSRDSPPQDNSHSLIIPSLSEYDHLYLQRGFEHHLKQMLINLWEEWIVRGLEAMRIDGWNDCYHVLADSTSKEAKWELTELDMQVVQEWVWWELTLLEMSIELERHLHRRMEGLIKRVMDERGNAKKEWLYSEWTIGQRKRLERERERAKMRMEEARKGGAERAEKEGRKWECEQGESWEKGWQFYNVQGFWESGQQFIDEKWTAVIKSGASPIKDSASKLQRLVDMYKQRNWMNHEQWHRFAFVEQLGPRFERWMSQRNNERREMEATIERIKQAEFNKLEQTYQYPDASDMLLNMLSGTSLATRIHSKFVGLDTIHDQEKAFAAKVSFATVYDVQYCDIEIIRDIVAKSTTCSVINVPDDLAQQLESDILDNRILYIQPRSKEPLFWNLDQWWKQQKMNAWTCLLSPDYLIDYYVQRFHGTIAHIMIFIQNPTRVRLRLLHRIADRRVFVSIQEQSMVLRHINADDIPRQLCLQDFDLDPLGRGQHHLELVVEWGGAPYGLRDVLVEFFDDDKTSEGRIVETESKGMNARRNHMQDGGVGLVEDLDNEVINVA